MAGRILAVGWIAVGLAVVDTIPGRAQRIRPIVGHVGVDSRTFFGNPISPDQPGMHSFSLSAQPEYSASVGGGVFFSGIARLRLDQHDPERRYVDAREAKVELDAGAVAATLGVNTVFWGVTESRHLVNIVNQIDYLEDLDGEEKFGQLMALVSYDAAGAGLFDAFLMSWFRPQLYPGRTGRPGVPVLVLHDAVVYESTRGVWNVDLALRWSHSRGEFDWALSHFHGTSREPELVPMGTPDRPVLQPVYSLIDQSGLELQWTKGEWLWKVEGIVRSGQGPTFAATTVGFEYLHAGALGSDADLALFLEYSYDGRDNLTFNSFDNDVFGGARLSLNDVPGSEVFVGALWDRESQGAAFTVEASRRMMENWRVELSARAFGGHAADDPLHWFRRDDYVQATVEYHF